MSYSVAAIHYFSLWDKLVINDGVLYHSYKTMLGDTIDQFIAPKTMKNGFLTIWHCSPLSGHLGIKKTKFRVTRHFYWYELKEEVRIFIITRENCLVNKPLIHKPKAHLGRMLFGAPLECLATDFIGPLPITKRKNRYIVVFSDYFTKWVEAFPVPEQTTERTAGVVCL